MMANSIQSLKSGAASSVEKLEKKKKIKPSEIVEMQDSKLEQNVF